MRKVILSVAVTLDGFIEGPNGEYDWCFTDQDYGMSAFLKRIDALFYGRKSYELVISQGQSAEGAGMFSHIRSYVFSNTLKEVQPPNILVGGDIKAEVMRIKAEPGKDIWLFGGASLTTAFFELGLVDELLLAVHPVLLGSGKLLFQDIPGRTQLKLLESTPYDSGLVMLRYAVL